MSDDRRCHAGLKACTTGESSELLTSFYEAVVGQAPFFRQRFEHTCTGAGSSRAGSPRRCVTNDPVVARSSGRTSRRIMAIAVHAPALLAVRVDQVVRPEDLLSVVTVPVTHHMRHAPGPVRRVAPSVKRFPVGTRRSGERRAPAACIRVIPRGDSYAEWAFMTAPSGITPCAT